MKAAVIYRYGPPEIFRIEDIPKPRIRPKEVLLKVHAASVNPVDWKQRKGNHRFFLKARWPVVPGYDVCGEVVETGSMVSDLKPGDRVFGRLRRKFGGAFASYAAAEAASLAFKPGNLDCLESAGFPMAGSTALQALRDKGRLKPGMEVLIIGAAGGVGHLALQIARILGARTTAVCRSSHKSLLDKLQPDYHIDYTAENYWEGEKQYDLILDAAGKSGFPACRPILKPKGIFITTLPRPKLILHKTMAIFTGRKRVRALLQRPRRKDLETMRDWIESGRLKLVVDSVYPLEAIAQAHHRAEAYQTEGKILIRIIDPSSAGS